MTVSYTHLDVYKRQLLQWPTEEAAQKAEMSTEAFADFFFDVCCVDYLSLIHI